MKKVHKLCLGSIFLMLFPSYALAQYEGKMINAHLHFLGNVKTELLLKELSKENTQAAILMPKFYSGGGPYDGKDISATDNQVEALQNLYPSIFFPLIGLQRDQFCEGSSWGHDKVISAMEAEIVEKLSSGIYFGAGELKVVHWAYGKHQNLSKRNKNCSEVNHNLDSPLVLAMLKQLKKFNKPLVIHMEATSKGVGQLKNVLQLGAKIVWAHNCGRARPDIIRSLLNQFDNLSCDLANMDDRGFYGSGQPRVESFTYLIMRDGKLDESQKNLMEDFPNRFMVGSDVAHTEGFEKHQVSKRLNRMRLMLGQLSPATAEKIAYQNAIQIFELPLKLN
jgi:hypothetical protein